MTTVVSNQDEFTEHVLQEQQPVVVKFFADWCKPCKQYTPTFEGVAEQHDDVKFVEVDIGQDPNLSMQYGIRSVPTTGAFRDGQMVESKQGVINEDSLSQLVESVK